MYERLYEIMIFALVFVLTFKGSASLSNFLAFAYEGIFEPYKNWVRKTTNHDFYAYEVKANDYDLINQGYKAGDNILKERHHWIYNILVGCCYCQNVWVTWALWTASLLILSSHGLVSSASIVVFSYLLIIGFSHTELQKLNE